MEQLPSPSVLKAKKMLLDPYASIALADSEQNNQRVQLELEKERARKAEVRRALDEQIRLKKTLEMKEKAKDSIWFEQEQARLKVWEVEEAKKAAEVAEREQRILAQRRQQLVEREAIKHRELAEKRAFETELLRGIQRDMVKEREVEVARKRAEVKNMEMVIQQNEKNKLIALELKEKEAEYIRQIEKEAKDVAERKAAQRLQQEKERLAKVRNGRGSQGGETMQERIERLEREDEARADARIAKDKADALAKIEAEKRWREQLKRDTLDMLAVQVKEKELRKQADLKYRETLVNLSKEETLKAEKMERMRKEKIKEKNMAYADELKAQIRMQQERKLMEPFLMTKAEREMNASLLRRVPS